MTNLEKIRGMTEKELAQFLIDFANGQYEYERGFCDCCEGRVCWACAEEWLKEESEATP